MTKNVWFLDYHLLTCSVRKMVLICLMQNIDVCLLYQCHQCYYLAANGILHIFLYNLVTSYRYIIVNSCIISFNLNCITLLKQFYNIASKVSSRKRCYYFWWSTWLVSCTSVLMPSNNEIPISSLRNVGVHSFLKYTVKLLIWNAP